MKRSFQSLTSQEALHVAIFIEERNSEIYYRFAEAFISSEEYNSVETAGVLWDMAVEERHHSSLLQERYTALYGQASCTLTDADILELIELPEVVGLEVLSSATPALTRARAIRVALSAENQARSFYAELAETADNPDLQSLYLELSSFEADHVTFLEKKLETTTTVE